MDPVAHPATGQVEDGRRGVSVFIPELFDKERACPKCGHANGRSPREQWCAGTTLCRQVFKKTPAIAENHFHRYCDRCSYEWYELPMDFDTANALPRCERCGATDEEFVSTGEVNQCPQCGFWWCESCSAAGCPGCEQVRLVALEIEKIAEAASGSQLLGTGDPGDTGRDADGGTGGEAPVDLDWLPDAGGVAEDGQPVREVRPDQPALDTSDSVVSEFLRATAAGAPQREDIAHDKEG